MHTKIVQLFVYQFIFLVISLPFPLCFCLETDTISSGSVIKDPDAVVSRRNVFKLGFFTPRSSTGRYLAVVYAVSEEAAIWIANRDRPLDDSSSYVTISRDGNLVLINARNEIVWSTNATTSAMNTTLQIQDTGNLVLRDHATGTTIWDSFSHPCDVFVPTMNISYNIYTGKKVLLTSWKSPTDPAEGSFTSGIQVLNIPQSYIWSNGRPRWRSGPWNGLIFIGIPRMYSAYVNGFIKLLNDSEGNFYYMLPDLKFLMKFSVSTSGSLARSQWDEQTKRWYTLWSTPENECDIYGKCGPFGSCDARGSPICRCLRGFEPVNKDEWEGGNWTRGCRRMKKLQCDDGGNRDGDGDGFFRMQFMKVPDFAEGYLSRREDECRTRCLGNCSCIAYAFESNIGCMFWRDSLIDVQKFNGVGVDLHIRLPASELDNHEDKNVYIIIPVVVAFVCVSIFIFVARCWMIRRKGDEAKDRRIGEVGQRTSIDSIAIKLKDELQEVNIEGLPLFTFEMLANATDQFDENNRLGRGGFGPVYKGNLENGKEIAVKRLSAASGQGMQEFMNEVILISKLQHRNLVRLLGCCVERGEMMLIYEFMPNKSLDICLFDPSHPSQKRLDWTKRFSIIEGIGRGLLYLHRDSRLRIIHRDLKPSNILLDEDWNPKISDFGMARMFGGDQDHGNTARVVGTHGYMAPEYAMEGRFSEKSDVYSFGVLMLEIVAGKKNINYYNREWSLSLLGCAWKLWSEDNGFAFADERIASSEFHAAEIVRCIQIALLCVQEFPKDRPTVQTVLSMLSCEIVDLAAPEKPVFAEKWNGLTIGSTQLKKQDGFSINELTLTVLDGR